MCMPLLLTPLEVDDVLRLKPGHSERLAKRDLLPHVTLPDGTIRFRRSDIESLIATKEPTAQAMEVAHA